MNGRLALTGVLAAAAGTAVYFAWPRGNSSQAGAKSGEQAKHEAPQTPPAGDGSASQAPRAFAALGSQKRPGVKQGDGATEKADPLLKKVAAGRRNPWDIYCRCGDGWANLTRFNRPQNIFGFRSSPNGRWAYVWHHEYPPRKLSIYDLETLQMIARFVPGFGGSMQWTAGNTIVHCWGAGTNWGYYRVYDVSGKIILADGTTGKEVSADGRYLVTFPSLWAGTEPLAVRELKGLTVVYSSRGGIDVRYVLDLKWLDPDTLRIEYLDSNELERVLVLPLAGDPASEKAG